MDTLALRQGHVGVAAQGWLLPLCFNHAGTVLDNTELRDKLSTQEQRFATDFFVAMGRHFKGSVLDDLPPAYQSLVRNHAGQRAWLTVRQTFEQPCDWGVGVLVNCRARQGHGFYRELGNQQRDQQA